MPDAPIRLARHPDRVVINNLSYKLYRGADGVPSVQIEDVALSNSPAPHEYVRRGGHPNEWILDIESAHKGVGDTWGKFKDTYDYCADIDCRFPGQIMLGRRQMYAYRAGGGDGGDATTVMEFDSKLFRIAGQFMENLDQRNGQAAQFTAANSEYLSIADNARLSMGDINCEFISWVYADTLPAAGNQMGLLGKWAAGDLEYVILIDNTGGTIRFQFLVRDTANTATTTVTATTFGTPSTATWYMIDVYHDATNNLIGISVNNGVADTAATSGGVRDGGAAFELGRHTAGNYFNGRLDSVAVWKKLLSTADKAWIYNGGVGIHFALIRNKPSVAGADYFSNNLIAWWDLEEASGTRVDAHSTGLNPLADNNTVTQAAGVENGQWATVVDTDLGNSGGVLKNGVVWRNRLWAGYLDVNKVVNNLYYRTTGNVPTVLTATGIARGILATTNNRLWGQTGIATIGYVDAADDPATAGNWKATATAVDDPNVPITGMIGLDDQLFIAKEDGLFFIDQNLTAHNITPDVRNYRSTANGAYGNLKAWSGFVCYATIRNLYMYRDGYVWDEHPTRQLEQSMTNIQIRGYITCLVPIGNDWLACILVDSNTATTSSYVFLGRKRRPDDPPGNNLIIWHSWTRITPPAEAALERFRAGTLSDIDVGANTQMQLWLASDYRTVAYDIVRLSDNPLGDVSEYAASGTITFPTYNMGFEEQKMIKRVVVLARGVGTGTAVGNIQLSYMPDGDGAFVDLGSAITVSGYTTITPTPVSAQLFTFRAVLTRATTGATPTQLTPVLLRIHIVFEVRPVTRRMITAMLDLTEDMVDDTNIRRVGSQQYSDLRTLSQNTAQVAYLDDVNTSVNVIVQQPIVVRQVRSQPDATARYVATVRMLEV